MYIGDSIMMRNITKVARKKTKEIRPRNKGLARFGSHNVGVRKNTVKVYEI